MLEQQALSLVQVDYDGTLDGAFNELLAQLPERPLVLQSRPLRLLVQDPDGFVARLQGVLSRSRAQNAHILLRRGAYVVARRRRRDPLQAATGGSGQRWPLVPA